MAVKIGDTAPDFNIIGTDRNAITLGQYKDKNLVLLFFPFAFSSTCTKELCQMRDDLHRYQGLNAEILGVSVDSFHALNKFRELERLPFHLGSDFNKDMARAYGCLQEEWSLGMKGVAKRSAFLIDKSAVIRYIEILENPGELPNFKAIQECLLKLRH